MRLAKLLIALIAPVFFLFSQGGPNHLEPSPYFPGETGIARLSRALLPKGPVHLWMMAAPSFNPDFSICLINTSSSMVKPNFVIRYHQASKNFLLPSPPPPPLPPGSKSKRIERPTTPTITRSIPVDTHLATAISGVWLRTLQRTRYGSSGSLHTGDDGCIYAFGMNGYLGLTWSPSAEIPSKLVELTKAMIDLVNSIQSDVSHSRSKILTICTELSNALDTEIPPRWP